MKEKLFKLKSLDSEIYNASRSSLDKAIRDLEGRIKEEQKKQKVRNESTIGCRPHSYQEYESRLSEISIDKGNQESDRNMQELIW